jgi:hypothetical protein
MALTEVHSNCVRLVAESGGDYKTNLHSSAAMTPVSAATATSNE